MKDILFTGNIACVTNAMIEKIAGKQKLVLCGETSVSEFRDKRVVTYPYTANDNEYRGIYRSYTFDTVIYFSRVLDGQKRLYDELENLENALYSATLSGVKNFIYLTTNDYADMADTTRTKLLKTCEDICKHFVDDRNINVLVLRVPYIFTLEETDCHIIRMAKQALTNNEIILDGSKNQVTDYVSDEDLGELFSRVYDEPLTGFRIIDIDGGNEMTMEQVGNIISKATGVKNIRYNGYKEAVPTSQKDGGMRGYYGWFSANLLKNEASNIVENLRQNASNIKKKKAISRRKKNINKMLTIAIEMLVVFIVAEALTIWTGDNYRMDYVDFRLLFVVIIGITHGTLAGIIASVLACIGYFSRDIMNSNLQIIFFNIENWLPFAAYFLSGTIVGHIRDKNLEDIRFLKEQQSLLENKYVFLSELYGKTLENKEEFSHQLISYEDSFGKIYHVVRKLNSTLTDNVFYEAVYSIEDILKTTSVAIYTIGKNNNYARLNVCSSEIKDSLQKSIDITTYPKLDEVLRANQNWYNSEGLKDYPAYASPVVKNGVLEGAIFIWNANAAQMRMDYLNKFSILSGLVQDALIRAIEYGEQQESNQLIEGTKILKPEYFEEIISMKEKMGSEGMYDYILLKVVSESMSLYDIGEKVSGIIRNTDAIGMRADNEVYILLAQTNEDSLENVRARMGLADIKLELV